MKQELRGSNRRLLLLAALALLAISQPSCIEPAQVRYQHRLEEARRPLQHAIHSERLQGIMQAMERLAVGRLPQEMDVRPERQQRIDSIVEISHAMALTAEAIPEVLEGVEISDASRREFLRLAGSLRDRSLRLSERAPQLTLGETKQELEAIHATCDECHGSFRILPVPPVP